MRDLCKTAILGTTVISMLGVFAAIEWDDPQVNSINREPARA